MPTLGIVISSVRPNRAGKPIADWFVDIAKAHGHFTIDLIDLKAVNLPILDEPNHPRMQQYERESTKAWSARVAAADAFVFVTPEYNFSTPPALVNALDYLYVEWNYKPAGFVSYGGISAGTRSVQATKQILTTLRMVPLVEAVNIPFFSQHLDKDTGAFGGTESLEKSARGMLDELGRWTGALAALRQ